MEVSSPFWRLWTFPFAARGAEVASVQKKWSGLLAEAFTDKDNFAVDFGTARWTRTAPTGARGRAVTSTCSTSRRRRAGSGS